MGKSCYDCNNDHYRYRKSHEDCRDENSDIEELDDNHDWADTLNEVMLGFGISVFSQGLRNLGNNFIDTTKSPGWNDWL